MPFTFTATAVTKEKSTSTLFTLHAGQSDKALATAWDGATLLGWKAALVGTTVGDITARLVADEPELYDSADDVDTYDVERVLTPMLKAAGFHVVLAN